MSTKATTPSRSRGSRWNPRPRRWNIACAFPTAPGASGVREGEFAGTRGHSLPITGVTVRVAETVGEPLEVQVRGLFVGGIAVDARGGRDCVTAVNARMRGVQVVLLPAKPGASPAPGGGELGSACS